MHKSRNFGALTATGAAPKDDFTALAVDGLMTVSQEHADASHQRDARVETGIMATQALTNLQELQPGLPQVAQIQRDHMDVVAADRTSVIAATAQKQFVNEGPATGRPAVKAAFSFPTLSPFGSSN